jgi:two-component system sensor histidine kinase KdpD
MERLYEVSRRILLLTSAGEIESLITQLLREVFELEIVQIFDAQTERTEQCGGDSTELDERAHGAYALNIDGYDPDTRSWRCVLRAGERPIGGLLLGGTEMTSLAATAVASLTAIALEHVRALQRESHAQAERETEQLRTAVLDALAHQIKTPLTIARTASSGLLALGGLTELQTDMVAAIDEQARSLDQIASHLLSAAMLDSAEFKPSVAPLLLTSAVADVIEKLECPSERFRFHVTAAAPEAPVLADRELIRTSLAQLVDNAVKYSDPESRIDVCVAESAENVILTVRTKGIVLPPEERQRVFERFYRAPATRRLPAGTGLGLSIVKKIVRAHQGHVWADGESGYGTSFSISLPAYRES